MKILYFAWVREKIGLNSEEVDLPKEVKTVGNLVNWLSKKSPAYNEALTNKNLIKFSVNFEFADLEHKVNNDDEIAIFPPVTGG